MYWKRGAKRKILSTKYIEENEPEKLNKLFKTDFAEVKQKKKKTVTTTCKPWQLYFLGIWMNKGTIFHHKNKDFKPRMLSVEGEKCPVALYKFFRRAKTSIITWDGVVLSTWSVSNETENLMTNISFKLNQRAEIPWVTDNEKNL